MNSALPLRVFVYGTLKPGGVGYRQFLQQYSVQATPAQTRGRLYDLPAGYPAMTLGDGWVQGVLLTIPEPSLLAKLDNYEDYHPERADAENLYYRAEIEVFGTGTSPLSLGLSWVYLMQPSGVEDLGGRWLENGDWQLENI
jgi:gamma-glutamylcyclotransferase (GGCT)/AIG2-like uncharacterized protein YtfP